MSETRSKSYLLRLTPEQHAKLLNARNNGKDGAKLLRDYIDSLPTPEKDPT